MKDREVSQLCMLILKVTDTLWDLNSSSNLLSLLLAIGRITYLYLNSVCTGAEIIIIVSFAGELV